MYKRLPVRTMKSETPYEPAASAMGDAKIVAQRRLRFEKLLDYMVKDTALEKNDMRSVLEQFRDAVCTYFTLGFRGESPTGSFYPRHALHRLPDPRRRLVHPECREFCSIPRLRHAHSDCSRVEPVQVADPFVTDRPAFFNRNPCFRAFHPIPTLGPEQLKNPAEDAVPGRDVFLKLGEPDLGGSWEAEFHRPCVKDRRLRFRDAESTSHDTAELGECGNLIVADEPVGVRQASNQKICIAPDACEVSREKVLAVVRL